MCGYVYVSSVLPQHWEMALTGLCGKSVKAFESSKEIMTSSSSPEPLCCLASQVSMALGYIWTVVRLTPTATIIIVIISHITTITETITAFIINISKYIQFN